MKLYKVQLLFDTNETRTSIDRHWYQSIFSWQTLTRLDPRPRGNDADTYVSIRSDLQLITLGVRFNQRVPLKARVQ